MKTDATILWKYGGDWTVEEIDPVTARAGVVGAHRFCSTDEPDAEALEGLAEGIGAVRTRVTCALAST